MLQLTGLQESSASSRDLAPMHGQSCVPCNEVLIIMELFFSVKSRSINCAFRPLFPPKWYRRCPWETVTCPVLRCSNYLSCCADLKILLTLALMRIGSNNLDNCNVVTISHFILEKVVYISRDKWQPKTDADLKKNEKTLNLNALYFALWK